MILSYIKILKRNIFRHPLHTTLNLACLTLGVTGTLLISLYLHFELTYDSYHQEANRIYRIDTKSIKTHEKTIDVTWNTTPAPLAPTFQQDYTGVESYARFFQFWTNESVALQYKGKIIEESNIYVADATALTIFTFNFIAGNKGTALNETNQIVLSQTLAKKIFGDESPIGKLVNTQLEHTLANYPSQYPLVVTGVYQDLPENVHLLPQALISPKTDSALEEYYYNRFNSTSYLLLSTETNPVELSPKLSEVYTKYLDSKREPVLVAANHVLTPIREIHIAASGGFTYIYIFSIVGLMLLIIAAISYVNLTTAQASQRYLEIGIRKVMGSQKKQLVFQFLGESVLFTFIALLSALMLIYEGLPFLNDTLSLRLDFNQLFQPSLLLCVIAIVLFLGILGGSYPAFFLAQLEPVKVIKGKVNKKVPLRKVLVAVQLSAVIFIITSTGMIYEQLKYLSNKDLGFNKEHVVRFSIPNEERTISNYTSLKDGLLQHPNILGVGISSFTPGNNGMYRRPISIDESPNQEQQFVYSGEMDEAFFEVMDIKLLEGRNFSFGDSSKIIVNQKLVNAFGLKEPLGNKIRFGGKGNPNFYTIIGVVEDFHQSSLYSPIEPQMFEFNNQSNVYVKVGADISLGLQHIQKSWAKVWPNLPFNFGFIEDELQDGYVTDQIRGKVFLLLAIFTIFIAFLGLFGLASFLATQRIKEIGIRKVLGASVQEIVLLMTKDFIVITLLAALPAFMFSWYIIEHWLANFAFRTEINYLLFAFALLFTLLLTFITTGLHAWRSASTKPLNNLRYE